MNVCQHTPLPVKSRKVFSPLVCSRFLRLSHYDRFASRQSPRWCGKATRESRNSPPVALMPASSVCDDRLTAFCRATAVCGACRAFVSRHIVLGFPLPLHRNSGGAAVAQVSHQQIGGFICPTRRPINRVQHFSFALGARHGSAIRWNSRRRWRHEQRRAAFGRTCLLRFESPGNSGEQRKSDGQSGEPAWCDDTCNFHVLVFLCNGC
jgi:hypothetical protein